MGGGRGGEGVRRNNYRNIGKSAVKLEHYEYQAGSAKIGTVLSLASISLN